MKNKKPEQGNGSAQAGMPKRPKVDRKTITRLLSYLRGRYLFLFGVVVFCLIVDAVAGGAGSLFLQKLIDEYIAPLTNVANPDFSGLLRLILLMCCIYVCGIVANLMYQRIMASISNGVMHDIRSEMFSKMQRLPLRYFDTHTHGDIMSHYTNDVDTLHEVLGRSIPQMFSACITIVVLLIAMLILNVWMTALVLLVVLLMIRVAGKIGGNSASYFIRQQKSLGVVNGYVEEMVNGQKVVKVFCHEEASKEAFDRINDQLCQDTTAANVFANILMPVMMNIGNIQYVLIAFVGGLMAIQGVGSMTIGTVIAFLTLSKTFTRPISMISQQINLVVMALAGAQRIFALMDQEPETDQGNVTLVNAKLENGVLTECAERTGLFAWKVPESDGGFRLVRLTGEVQFFDVDFGYVPEKMVLHNITLDAKPGEKIAFVGATGAGKTTITNLINRFYDIADGKIRYDGININKICKADLRRSLGIVLQDVNLFTGTVLDNIRYGRLDATDEECIAAAKVANAHEFISRLPQGYDTMLAGDGSNLSQGQRQLLSIARCAVADPPVMILDEATSSIDTRTEALVQRGMDQLMEGRTVFIIAHRLSTVKNSDNILVLEHGNIIERGSHNELVSQKGKYYQLYTGAFELE
ncbi:MAG: ABC transporter ATP-binding protein [Oscillospiraceae bacterium]